MEKQKNILLIDIGGTFTKVKIINFQKKKRKVLYKKIKKIRSKIEFFNFLKQLVKYSPFEISVFSIAGPVFENSFFLTNWEGEKKIKISELKLKSKEKYFLNDMEAQGYGLLKIKNEKAIKLHLPKEVEENGNMALIITGTGLGSCAIIKNEVLIPLELQHSTFYPNNKKMRKYFEKIIEYGIIPSYESFVSSKGLLSIYSILKNSKDKIKDPNILNKKALNGDEIAKISFEIYFYVLSLYCQTLALAFKPLSGIYIGGKAIEKNKAFLNKKKFIKIFLDNPKQKVFLKKIPIYLIEKNLIFDGLLYFLKKMNYDKIFENERRSFK